MKAVCLVDSSVFYELIIIRNQEYLNQLETKILGKEALFLPMATVMETGNHIGQIADGGKRRKCAEDFVNQIKLAIRGETPFTPINFLEAEDLQKWLDEFPDWAMRGAGLGDLSIVQDWKRLCQQNKGRKVYIWSNDDHLAGHERGPEI